MNLDSESVQHLKPWLIRTLEPICDAEPGALTDYILALLKHNVQESELRKDMEAQLEEFLEKECSPFLDTLFTALRTKSYVPYSATSPTPVVGQPIPTLDNGIPIPLDDLLPSDSRGQKRNLDSDDRDPRGPPKGPRLNGNGQFSRYGQGRADTNGGWNNRGPPVQRNNGAYNQPRRGICRDYHNTGFCARGANCKYSHGDDAMVPGQMFPGMPFMPMFMNGFGMAPGPMSYDPNESRMDMNGQFQQLPPGQQQQYMAQSQLPVVQDGAPSGIPVQQSPDAPGSFSAQPPEDVEMGTAQAVGSTGQPRSSNSRGRGGRGGGRVNGVFNGDAASFSPQRPERRKDKTLVIERIPEDKLSLDQINDWFKRFGSVTNVAIDRPTSKALISFSDHQEAYNAWKAEDAVFNNRFVKVFWHRPMEGHGSAGSRQLAASANVVASLSHKDNATPAAPPAKIAGSSALSARKPSAPASGNAAALAAKQQLLEKLIGEQKTLMTSLGSASSEEKKTIMSRLRELGKEMEAAKSDTAPATGSSDTTPAPIPAARRGKEPLDKESDVPMDTEGGGETSEELRAKLEKLKAEAASLGIPESDSEPYYGGSYRGYRGRGRGRGGGYYRGAMRGGPPRTSMKLDNRPRKLVVRGVQPEHVQTLQDWYETTGQVDSISTQDDGSISVLFKSRPAAEQGLAKGTNVPLIGQIDVAWDSSPTNAPTRPASTPAPTKHALAGGNMDETNEDLGRAHSPRLEEDEDVANGWGRGDDDAM